MSKPTINRFRYPWRLVVPGDDHAVIVNWSPPANLAAKTYELVMRDALTHAAVTGVTYTPNMAAAATGVLQFVAAIPADIDTTKLYELRLRQLTPTVETLISGYVTFAPSAIAGVL